MSGWSLLAKENVSFKMECTCGIAVVRVTPARGTRCSVGGIGCARDAVVPYGGCARGGVYAALWGCARDAVKPQVGWVHSVRCFTGCAQCGAMPYVGCACTVDCFWGMCGGILWTVSVGCTSAVGHTCRVEMLLCCFFGMCGGQGRVCFFLWGACGPHPRGAQGAGAALLLCGVRTAGTLLPRDLRGEDRGYSICVLWGGCACGTQTAFLSLGHACKRAEGAPPSFGTLWEGTVGSCACAGSVCRHTCCLFPPVVVFQRSQGTDSGACWSVRARRSVGACCSTLSLWKQ